MTTRMTLKEHVVDGQRTTLAETPKMTIFRFADGDSLFNELEADNPAVFIAVDTPRAHGEKNDRMIIPTDGKGGILSRHGSREVITYPAQIMFHPQGLQKKRLHDVSVGTVIRLAPANSNISITQEEMKALESDLASMVVGETKEHSVPVIVLSEDATPPCSGI